LFIEFATTCL
jgi:hypothetical protein